MKLLVLLAILVFLLSGCASRKKRRERRAQRKIERARELAPQMFKLDTVVIRDTIVIERKTVDTVTHIRFHDTTVIVNNDRVVARYYYDTTRMEIHHDIECKEIHKPIETRVVVEKFEMLSWYDKNAGILNWILIILTGCGVLVFIYGKAKN